MIRVPFGSLIINTPLIIKTTWGVYYLAELVLGGRDYTAMIPITQPEPLVISEFRPSVENFPCFKEDASSQRSPNHRCWSSLGFVASLSEHRVYPHIYIYICICIHYKTIHTHTYIYITEGSLEVTLPTIWTDRKSSSREKRREEERRSKKRKSQKKEDLGARKGRKVEKHCVFANDLWLRRVEQ